VVRVAISVEGQTEERFVNKVLVPYFQKKEIYMQPILLSGGGDVYVPRIKKDLNYLARSFDKVTTLYDFYGFRGKDSNENRATLEQKILASVAAPLRDCVIPYVQMYEFEGLLFSSPEAIENNIQQRGLAAWATEILDEFEGDPEKINDSIHTAPSKRLLKKADYIKTVHGPDIAQEIGLNGLRKKCSGFDAWLKKLEEL